MLDHIVYYLQVLSDLSTFFSFNRGLCGHTGPRSSSVVPLQELPFPDLQPLSEEAKFLTDANRLERLVFTANHD